MCCLFPVKKQLVVLSSHIIIESLRYAHVIFSRPDDCCICWSRLLSSLKCYSNVSVSLRCRVHSFVLCKAIRHTVNMYGI